MRRTQPVPVTQTSCQIKIFCFLRKNLMTKVCLVDERLTASPGVVSPFAASRVLWVENRRLHGYFREHLCFVHFPAPLLTSCTWLRLDGTNGVKKGVRVATSPGAWRASAPGRQKRCLWQ